MNRPPSVQIGALVPLTRPGAAIPFLRYLPDRLSPLGARVEKAIRERLAEAPSFVAFEGSRGQITFSRTPGVSVWQWAWAPVQVVDRDPAEPGRFRILHAT